jgi:membrane protein
MDRLFKWLVMALAGIGVLTAFRGRPPGASVGGSGEAGARLHTPDGDVNREMRSDATAPADDGPDSAGPRGHHSTSPTDIPKPGWKAILLRVKEEIKRDKVPVLAAAVAFAALLSLFPLMIAGISIYGLVADPETVARQAQTIQDILPSDAASLITGQLQDLAAADNGALGVAAILSILVALWSASGGMSMLINALNVAYDEDNERGFVKNKALALLMTFGAIVFLLVVAGLLTLPADILGDLGTIGVLFVNIIRWVLLAALLAVALAVVYRVAPDRDDARWQWITPGAAVAVVLWLVASAAFSFFVDRFGSYNQTYGSLAGVVVLMLWLQLSTMIVLIGAEINAETERQTASDTTTGPPQPLGQRGANPADTPPPDRP